MQARITEVRRRATIWGQQHPIAMMFIVIACVVVILLWWLHPSSATERADFVKTTAQALGGVALLGGLYFTYRTVQASQKTLALTVEKQDLDRKSHELVRVGQIADRFTKSLEQLGSPSEGVRIGALYALERLAKDHDDYYQQVIEVICSFVRRRSQDEDNKIDPGITEERRNAKASLDVEAAMLILLRRSKRLGYGEQEGLDLRGANLCGLKFDGGDFQHADLSGALLIKAQTYETNFAFARFGQAHLEDSYHRNCNFVHADFASADISDSEFEFYDLVDNPWNQVASVADVGVFQSFGPPIVEKGQKLVSGGLFLDASTWIGTTMSKARFTTPLLPRDAAFLGGEQPLDLSGMQLLTQEQYESFWKPDDAIPPTFIELDFDGLDDAHSIERENGDQDGANS